MEERRFFGYLQAYCKQIGFDTVVTVVFGDVVAVPNQCSKEDSVVSPV